MTLVDLGLCGVAGGDVVEGVLVSNAAVDVLDRPGEEFMLCEVLLSPLTPVLVGVSGE